MVTSLAFLFFLAIGVDGDSVRLGVLGRLEPQAVVVTGARRFSVTAGQTSAVRRVRIERSGDFVSVVGRSGERWIGQRVLLRPDLAPLRIDVAGRDVRSRLLASPVEVTSRAGRLVIVATVPLDRVVASAVRAELEGIREPAALEAAAIAFRSYVIASGARHPEDGFDLCDTTHCLYSRGDEPALDAATRAVRTTRDRVLTFEGQVIAGYCSGVCGGGTTTPAVLWGGPDTGAYRPVTCQSCSAADLYRWRRRATARDVTAALSAILGAAVTGRPILSVEPGPNGWLRVVRVGGRSIRADEFRLALARRLGWDALPSSRFTVAAVGGSYEFRGRGHGHGIGLCLAGAAARARRGASADEILETYFPAATIAIAPDAPSRLPSERRGV